MSETVSSKEQPIPPERAVMVVPAGLMQGIVNYLQTRPWKEVDLTLQALKEIPIVDKRAVEKKE